MSKETYKQNRDRVFAIYGINPNDPNYSCHHLLFKSDFKKHPEMWKDHRVNELSNLCPLPTTEHARLHDLINTMEPPDQPKHRRKHHR